MASLDRPTRASNLAPDIATTMPRIRVMRRRAKLLNFLARRCHSTPLSSEGSLLRRAKARHCVTGPSRAGQSVTHTLLANARFPRVSSLLLGESNLNLGLDGA